MQKKNKISGDELAVGGQAVLEGVMMRAKDKYVVSVRSPSGEIKELIKKVDPKKGMNKTLRNIPFVRGIFVLFDSMKIGFKALDFSSDVLIDEDESSDDTKLKQKENAEKQKTKSSSKKTDLKKTHNKKEGKEHKSNSETKGMGIFVIITFILSMVFAIFLFKFIPYWTSGLISNSGSRVWIEGIIKASIFIGYLLLISLNKDVKRVFMYHGAEHKSIHCYEKYGLNGLTVKRALKQSRIHKRCGTTFLFLTIFISIVVYAFIPFNYGFWISFGLRILFLPLIAGISFEILKLVPKLSNKNPIKWILFVIEYPGLLMQNITTKEPNAEQLEVAINSLKRVLE